MTTREYADDSGLVWRKANRSNAGNNCVEVAQTPAGYLIRDSKDPGGPRLALHAVVWDTLITEIKNGKYQP